MAEISAIGRWCAQFEWMDLGQNVFFDGCWLEEQGHLGQVHNVESNRARNPLAGDLDGLAGSQCFATGDKAVVG